MANTLSLPSFLFWVWQQSRTCHMIGARGVIIICTYMYDNYNFSQLDVADRYIAANRERITIIQFLPKNPF